MKIIEAYMCIPMHILTVYASQNGDFFLSVKKELKI